MDIDTLRETPLDDLRSRFEKRSGEPSRIRGAASSEELNVEIDELLGR